MKKIILLGDSIRLGYDVMVREAYHGTAEVFFPAGNCCFAAVTLRNLHEWKAEMNCGDDVDLVHWNVGAWDTLILYEDGPLTPIAVYQEYIERICRRIERLFPNAKSIFATTTPMDEARFTEPEFAMRYNRDVEAYNAAAMEAVQKYGHTVNDLYGLMSKLPLDYHSDMTHYYTRPAAKIMVGQVCAAIDDCLGIKAGRPDYDFWFDETDCYEGGAWLRKRAGNMNRSAVLGM